MPTVRIAGPGRWQRVATTAVVVTATLAGGATAAGATSIPTAQFAITDFATGFSTTGSGVGPVGLAFDGQGRLFVNDYANGNLVRIPAAGGQETGNVLGNLNAGLRPAGLTFGRDGRLYVARQAGNDVIEVDPATGGVLRTVASGLNCATGIATDPLTGDLFVSRIGCASQLTRIADPASATPTVSSYPPVVGSIDGMTIASSGTIYVEANGCAVRIDGTSVPSPASSTVACVSTMDGIALSNNTADPSKPLLFTDNNNGTMTSIDTSTAPPTQTTVATGGTRGDLLTVGPDGCIYATQSTTVERVTKANGACAWRRPRSSPNWGSRPTATADLVGTAKAFTATFQRVTPKANIDVTPSPSVGQRPHGHALTDSRATPSSRTRERPSGSTRSWPRRRPAASR